jgi:hypothetical protein
MSGEENQWKVVASGSSLCKQNQALVPQDGLGHNLEAAIVCEVVTERRREVEKGRVGESRQSRRSQDSVSFKDSWNSKALKFRRAECADGMRCGEDDLKRLRPETGKCKSQAGLCSVRPARIRVFRFRQYKRGFEEVEIAGERAERAGDGCGTRWDRRT